MLERSLVERLDASHNETMEQLGMLRAEMGAMSEKVNETLDMIINTIEQVHQKIDQLPAED